ncbi:MAG: 50S ribosomal protein L4 [Candidatus Dormibacteria bacterium]
MPSAPLLDQEGEAAGNLDLAESVFAQDPHRGVMHQALVRQQAGARQGTHDTKTRGEVSGGGRKPYRQKGTGRARQGSIRAPQWRGGGTVFGPTPHLYRQRLPRKERRLALRSALAARATDQAISVVERLEFAEPKTARLATFLDRAKAGRRVLLVLGERDHNLELSARNIPQLKLLLAQNLNVRDVLAAESLVLTREALDQVVERLG